MGGGTREKRQNRDSLWVRVVLMWYIRVCPRGGRAACNNSKGERAGTNRGEERLDAGDLETRENRERLELGEKATAGRS